MQLNKDELCLGLNVSASGFHVLQMLHEDTARDSSSSVESRV